MERRKEPRFAIHQPVEMTVLGDPASAPFQAVAVEMSGSGMRIESLRAVSYQAAVKVRAGDLLLLGEVIRVQESQQGHTLTLKLQHSLDMAGDLVRLHEAIRPDDVAVPASAKISAL
jgi:hypothetical protein